MPRLLAAVLLALATCRIASGQTYTITTVAGGGTLPANVAATSVSIGPPQAVAADAQGNIYFAAGCDVLRLDASTGVLTQVAGNGMCGFSGDTHPATSAQLDSPQGLAVDSAGNLYIADTNNNRIRKVSGGIITTVAGNGTIGSLGDGGPAVSAQLSGPYGVAVDSAGNLYIADSSNHRIRKVSGGIITTVAGSGTPGYGGDASTATNAQLSTPEGVAVSSGGDVYIADTYNHRIRRVSGGVIATVAGGGSSGLGDNGPPLSAQLSYPRGVALDSGGNLYIADTFDNRIRKVSLGRISTVVGGGSSGLGDNGPPTGAQLNLPRGATLDPSGNLFIADTSNSRIRKVSGAVITTVAGNGIAGFNGNNGPATSARLDYPEDVAVDASGNLFIAVAESNLVLKVANGTISVFAGNGTSGSSGDYGPATSAQLNGPYGVAVDSAGNLYIADSSNNRIRKVSGGIITTVAGSGTPGYGGDNQSATSAKLFSPSSVAVDSAGSLYIADMDNHRIRKVSGGIITTVAGSGVYGYNGDNQSATSAQLFYPRSVAVDSAGNLYIADFENCRVREVSGGVITTVAGNGTYGSSGDNGPAASATVSNPTGVAVDSAGSLYITSATTGRIRKVTNGVITTAAGGGASVPGDSGPATGAHLYGPAGIALDPAGRVYFADPGDNRVRLLTPSFLPAISSGGVVPVYSPVPVIQPGSWVSIYGSNLAGGTYVWNGDFPTSLGGTSVTVNGKPGYLWYVSPTQINLQAPDDTATGPVNVAVTTAAGTGTATVTLAAYGPSFSLLDARHAAGVIPTPNGGGAYGGGTYDLLGPAGTFSYNTRPVRTGEALVLYGVGFGPTSPSVPAGQAFSGAAPTASPVTVTIGGVPANVAFAGLTMAGLYQINLTVPPGTGSGDRPLAATVNGVQTPAGPVVAVQ